METPTPRDARSTPRWDGASGRVRSALVASVLGLGAAASALAPKPVERLLTLDGTASVAGALGGRHASQLTRGSSPALAPAEAGGGVIFNEIEDAFRATEPIALPETRFSIECWASVETPRRWGGLLGAIEDNGAFEKGWILGYDDAAFTFGLSTAAADDGDGKLVYLRADRTFELGRWHHVVATYDGVEARLYVDGTLAASHASEAESPFGGPIIMADSCKLTVGAYWDADEQYPHDGRIAGLVFSDELLTARDVAARAREGRDLAAAMPWTDAIFEWTIPPYLTWPQPDGVSVLAETRTASCGTLEVRAADSAAWTEYRPVEKEAARLHEFVVRGLQPDTKYFYRVQAVEALRGREETTILSETRSFRTAPSGDDRAFTFTVIGDTQTNGAVAGRVSQLAFEHRPSFVVHCGDLVDAGSSRSDWTETFFPNMRPLIEHAPLVPVLGNHEQDARLYYDLMSLPEPERWYSLRYGHAEFFMLDGNRSLSDQSEQLKWLKGALADSDATWRFAVLHQPPFTSDSNDYGDTAQEASTRGDLNVRNIVQHLEEHGVDLCFSGHVHDYERTFPIRDGAVVPYEEGGIVYVTAAGGGGSLEDFDGTNTWFGHKKMRRHHFIHVAIHGDHLELQAMDEDGRLFDVFSLMQRGR